MKMTFNTFSALLLTISVIENCVHASEEKADAESDMVSNLASSAQEMASYAAELVSTAVPGSCPSGSGSNRVAAETN